MKNGEGVYARICTAVPWVYCTTSTLGSRFQSGQSLSISVTIIYLLGNTSSRNTIFITITP